MVGRKLYIRYALGIFLIILLITVYLGFQIPNAKFDYDFEKFFPEKDAETTFFQEHRKRFHSDNDFLLISIENSNGIFQQSFLTKVDEYVQSLEKIEDVTYIVAITNHQKIFIYPNNVVDNQPYINFEKNDFAKDSIEIYQHKELVGNLVSKDGKSICLFLKHTDFISKKKSDRLIENINDLSLMFGFERIRIAGRTIGQKYYIDKMTFEMFLYVGFGIVLVNIFLFISFRSGWGLVLPQFVVIASTVWVLGGMGLFSQPINIVLITLPSIMFVVGMSDVIHLVSRFLDALRLGLTKLEAIKVSLREVGISTLLTSVTTTIGFYSLLFVNVEPIKKFGLVIGSGVLTAFVLTIVTLPTLFYLFPAPKYVTQRKENFWTTALQRYFKYVLQHPLKIAILSIVVLIISGIGLTKLTADNNLMEDIAPSDPLKVDFNFLDANYSGIRPFEMSVHLLEKDDSFWKLANLQALDSLENYLKEAYGVSIRSSLVQSLKVLNRSSHSGNPQFFQLPTKQSKVNQFKRMLTLAQGGKILNELIDSTGIYLRISGGLGDIGNQAVRKKNQDLWKYVEAHNLNKTFTLKLTGTAHLLDKNMSYLSASLIRGLSVSVLVVALIMGLLFRSMKMVIISIIPNIIPLVVIAGIMGFTGIHLKTSTAIIFTIAFGIAVDDTIHLLGKFKMEMRKGRSPLYALKRSYLVTGKAMILTTLILCSGFLLLIFSSFLGTFYMGLLLCITLFTALIADMTLLPVLLIYCYQSRSKSQDFENK